MRHRLATLLLLLLLVLHPSRADGTVAATVMGPVAVDSSSVVVGDLAMLVESGAYGVTAFPSISAAPRSPGVNILRFDAGPRPMGLGRHLEEIVRGVGPVPSAAALAVLLLAVSLLVVRSFRKPERTSTAFRGGEVTHGASRSDGSVRPSSRRTGRRSGVPPLFAGRDEELDQLTLRLRDADDPLAIIDALRGMDFLEAPEWSDVQPFRLGPVQG